MVYYGSATRDGAICCDDTSDASGPEYNPVTSSWGRTIV